MMAMFLLLHLGNTVSAQPEHYTLSEQEKGTFIGTLFDSWDFPASQLDPMGKLQAAGLDPPTIAKLRKSTSEFSRWHALALHNPGPNARDMLLEFEFTALTDIEFFSFRNGQLQNKYRAGLRRPFTERPIKHRFPMFPVHIPAGETTFVLLVYNLNHGMLADQLRDNAYLWDEKTYFYDAHTSEQVYWLFFGAFMVMILYHAVAAMVTRDRIYIFYTGFCATYLMLQMSLTGFAFQIFWPGFPALNLSVLVTSLALMPTLLAHFTLAFLDREERYGKLRKGIWGVTVLCFAALLPAFVYFSVSLSAVSVAIILTILCLALIYLMGALVLGLLEWSRGNPRGRQFTTAWGLFLIAQSSGILVWVGLLDSQMPQAFLSMSGALFSLSLISVYMAERASRSLVKHELATALMKINNELAVEVQERKLAEARAWHLAHHDTLTGLPTLRLARERLQQATAIAKRADSKTAVLFIDLDGFKAVNDNFGHETGDQLLQQLAARMSACVRESDTVARVGGDEFLIIQTGILHESAIDAVANKLLLSLSEDYVINNQTIKVSASIGIALCPDHGTDMGELVKLADKAMYAIKQSGKNNYGFVKSVTEK